ncbi:MAG: glycosyltransferase family 2 protein, partial [Deltaproteobacteria bacterium]|nr:glycosyltransferase family 2 protein [Deltaproteobacteria bacterium]
MKPLTIVTSYRREPLFEKTLLSLTKSALVDQVLIISQEQVRLKKDKCGILIAGPLTSHETLNLILGEIQTGYLLLLLDAKDISIGPEALEKFLKKAESTKVGLVYSDFYEEDKKGEAYHPLNDYQPGSVRDDFDFGVMILFSVSAVRNALKKYGGIPKVNWGGLYDLRLKISIDHSVYHLKEPLYTVTKTDEPSNNEKLFAYVDPQNQAAQKEMETVFTDYLKRIGAYLPPNFKDVEQAMESFPVEASV